MVGEGKLAGSTTGADDRPVLRHALRFPRGRYVARRAAQLSGIPERTVYEWAQERILVPDFWGASPMRWSYRDLVHLRLLTQLRAHGMSREKAAERVLLVRDLTVAGTDVDEVRLTDRSLLLPGETYDRLTGEAVLGELTELTGRFDLLDPIAGISTDHLWGPNLVKPSDHTFIAPAVLGGEPCIEGSRVTTASIHALADRRGMSSAHVVDLYPQLSEESVEDALSLERRMGERKAVA